MTNFFTTNVERLSHFSKFIIVFPVLLTIVIGCCVTPSTAATTIIPNTEPGALLAGTTLATYYNFTDVFYMGPDNADKHCFLFFKDYDFDNVDRSPENLTVYIPQNDFWYHGDDFCWWNDRRDVKAAELCFAFQDYMFNWTKEGIIDLSKNNYYRFDFGLNFGGPTHALCKPSNLYSIYLSIGDNITFISPTSVYDTADYNGTSRTTATFSFVVPSSFFVGKENTVYNMMRMFFIADYEKIASVRFRIDPDVGFTVSEISQEAYNQWVNNEQLNNSIDNLGATIEQSIQAGNDALLNAGSDKDVPDLELDPDVLKAEQAQKEFDATVDYDSSLLDDVFIDYESWRKDGNFQNSMLFVRNNLNRFFSDNVLYMSFLSIVLMLLLMFAVLGRSG